MKIYVKTALARTSDAGLRIRARIRGKSWNMRSSAVPTSEYDAARGRWQQRGLGRPGDRSDRQKVVHWPENVWFEVWYGNHFRFLATTNSTCIERDRVWTLVLMMVLESVVRGLNGKSGKAKMAFVCLRCGGGGGKISSSIVFHDFH